MIQEQEIQSIFENELQLTVNNTTRLLTGYCHYVYRVNTDNQTYILRVSKPETVELLKGASFWLHYLQSKNIAIPKIIVNGTEKNPPYLILNFFEGDDLGNLYYDLSAVEKKQIALHLVSIQKTIQTLPQHTGFGYLKSYEDTNYENTWKLILQNHLQRSKDRFIRNNFFNMQYIEKAENLISKHEGYFNKVKPVPFLDDATTKNVIIHNGKFQGIVDIDFLCFGDYLLNVGLIKMALLSSESETDYVEYIINEYSLNKEQRQIVDLYTLLYCLDFMSEIGMTFNRDKPISAPPERIELLKNIFSRLSHKLNN